jgi:2-oxoisovalerate dehydrogenase E1 component
MSVIEKPHISFDRKGVSDHELHLLYEGMKRPRMIEEKMLKLLRQGKVSKWFSGIGEEAISVGVTHALEKDDAMFTLHRNLGVFTARNVPLERLFAQWQGKASGFTNGRDRSFHFGAPEYNIVGMISHLGPQLALACGKGLAYKIKEEPKVAVAFTGEGGTSQGDFHEALNVAAVWKLPVIFVINNNGYGLSTPTEEQYLCQDLADRAIGYGMEAQILDGNNVIEIYQAVRKTAASMRSNPRPVLLECKTFRMRGHEEASGTKYVPKELMEKWALKDPITNFESFLISENLLSVKDRDKVESKIKFEIEEGLRIAGEEVSVKADLQKESTSIFRPFEYVKVASGEESRDMRLIDAIKDGLDQAMQKHPNLILMGQDIAEYGGVFKITEGFLDRYGKDRVRNTPLCESAIVGTALGLSLEGMKVMVEMQFADFVTCGFNQIINNLAKLNYRWGGRADVVIRMPSGGGVGAGPFHSQTNEAWFFHTPGLKIAYPSNPYDAKGLLLTAFEDPNPVLFFEHKGLYRNFSAQVPEGYYNLPFGKAAVAWTGKDATIITYGIGVHWAQELAKESSAEIEIIDLRTLTPIDYDTIAASIRKTNRVLILHEDTLTGGIGGEIAAWIGEHLFDVLDAPVIRCASLDTPVPFAEALETQFMAKARLEEQFNKLLSY